MSGEDDGGAPRVSIPESLGATIQGIKEIAVSYSDEDIYGMLQECNMDSHETTHKLLYLDTFQLVKSKRKPRVIRDDQYPFSYSDNNNGGRKLNYNLQRRPHKSSMPVPRKESSKSPAVGSSSDKITSQPAKLNGIKGDTDGKSRKTSSLGPVSVNRVSDPGLTTTSTPTNTSMGGSSDRKLGGSSNPKQSKLGNGVIPPSASGSGLCPVSDPELVPSLNIKNSLPVGTIKSETTKNQDVSRTLASGSVDLTSSSTQSEVNGSLKEMLEDPCSKNASSDLDAKPRRSVIFPAHFHVPENFKNAVSFGSFESNEGSSDSSDPEASPILQSPSPISGHYDYSDQSANAPLNLTSSEENILSGADLRYDQSEQEIDQPSNGSLLDYGSSLVPTSVQLQGLEIQAESSLLTTGTTPSPTQQTIGTTPSDLAQSKLGPSQSSVPASPHVYPPFQQAYPTNFMSYSPYYPGSLYVPHQNGHHQLLGHNGYPHHSLASEIYKSPSAVSTSGPKFPSAFKPGSMTHFGAPSVYGSGGSFPDEMRSELKEKNLLSNLPLHGRNSFPGMYYPSQSIPTQPLHQSQPSSAVPPSLGSYPQPQYGQQMVWGKKL